MTKKVKDERVAIVLTLTREDGTGPVELKCRVDYEVSSEDLCVPRSWRKELTPGQEAAVKTFVAQCLAELKQIEEGV